MTFMKKTFLALVLFLSTLSGLCSSPNDWGFKCHSENSLWTVEKERGKGLFSFWYKDRLVAYRHLLWEEDQLFTNGYDLDFRVDLERGEGKGSLYGRLMGQNLTLKKLTCKETSPNP